MVMPGATLTTDEKLDLIMERLELMARQQEVATPVTIPLTPEILNDVLESYGERRWGVYMTMKVRAVILVPAHDSRTLDITAPRGWVCTKRRPLSCLFDYHHPDIRLTLIKLLWGSKTYVLVDRAPCTADFEGDNALSFGDLYAKGEEDIIRFTIENGCDTDTMFTFTAKPNLIEKTFFYDVYLPLLRHNFDVLEKLGRVLGRVLG